MTIQDYPFVVVGSGFLGSVIAERIASQSDRPVLVIEKRSHIGGNCYSETDRDSGIEYHRYGTHIFHTSNEKVWNYIRQFASFNSYRHRVVSNYKDEIYPFPINLGTINQFYRKNLTTYELDDFMKSVRGPSVKEPDNFEEQAIALLGRELYEAFFKHYTIKQWQADPRKLPASIFNRIPFRKNYADNYFFDTWQGIPEKGYTAVFHQLLAHPKIRVMLNTDYFSLRSELKKEACIIYSGPIDRFFDYKHGKLSWRTLRFEKETLPVQTYQNNAVVNFPGPEIPYTRIHEPRHLHPERNYGKRKTIIFREYSLPDQGDNPYYPIVTDENKRLLDLYKKEADQLSRVLISGRLGDYKYYDMHETIERALELFETRILPLIRLNHDN